MSDPSAEHLTSRTPSGALASAPATLEPTWALLVGSLAGAACFFLFALLFGARWAIAVAVVASIVALARRMRIGAVAFIAAAALAVLAAIGAVSPVSVLFVAGLLFGAALAIAARDYARAHGSAVAG
jgi:hypothetical protein